MVEKPILFAGKSGQLARCLLDSVTLRNVLMVVVGRPELDLESGEDIDRVMAAVDPLAIVNAAAYTVVDQAEAEPGRAFAINCGGAALLADAAARHGIPLIHVSTDYFLTAPNCRRTAKTTFRLR
jgi:dTDP-4-dehydrorhamnose reductase